MRNSTALLKSVEYHTKEIKSCNVDESITERQERVPGFNQLVLNELRVVLIGAGGLGGEIAQGLVRKGVGFLRIFDGDTVELSNLSRQFFYEEDLYRNKAVCLAKNLVKEGIRKTEIVAHPFMFQKAAEKKIDTSCDIAICAPDNDKTRVFTAEYFHDEVPVIFTGLDRNANTGYVFIQEMGKACFGCALPHAVRNMREFCPNVPAVIDLAKIIAGYVLFAVDSTAMERKRSWNYRQVFMAGFIPEIVRNVKRKKGCTVCRW
jgi:molybdopterin/thiamine biosynthesis adenylyltransferase